MARNCCSLLFNTDELPKHQEWMKNLPVELRGVPISRLAIPGKSRRKISVKLSSPPCIVQVATIRLPLIWAINLDLIWTVAYDGSIFLFFRLSNVGVWHRKIRSLVKSNKWKIIKIFRLFRTTQPGNSLFRLASLSNSWSTTCTWISVFIYSRFTRKFRSASSWRNQSISRRASPRNCSSWFQSFLRFQWSMWPRTTAGHDLSSLR